MSLGAYFYLRGHPDRLFNSADSINVHRGCRVNTGGNNASGNTNRLLTR